MDYEIGQICRIDGRIDERGLPFCILLREDFDTRDVMLRLKMSRQCRGTDLAHANRRTKKGG